MITTGENEPDIAPAILAIREALEKADTVDLSPFNLPSEPNRWTMDEKTLRFLVAIVRCLRPSRIVEFGSGLSTHVLATASIEAEVECSLVSLDHDPEYGRLDTSRILTEGSCVSAKGILAPLVLREFAGNLVPAYCFSEHAIAEHLPADLIVIDGPPELLGGRKGTLFQAMNMARPGTLILLDDAGRISEREAIAEWQRFFGNAIDVHMLSGFPKGLGAILIREPVLCRNLLAYHQRLLLAAICKSIPQEQTFAIFDDNYFADARLSTSAIAQNAIWVNDGTQNAPFDNESATRCLSALRERGVEFVVLTWPAFWWADHFGDFAKYLRTHFVLLREDSRSQVFHVRNY